jgi:hypothetical protein
VVRFLPSELPVRATARQHWIILFRKPHKYSVILLAVLLLAAWLWPWPMALILTLTAMVMASFRWREWRAEQIILTQKRVIHVQGIPETVSGEAWLRLDRISGTRFIETVPGKIFRYANIHLEAPGDHPGLSRLIRMDSPGEFYEILKGLVLGDESRDGWASGGDPDDSPTDYVTEPLPTLEPKVERDRFGRRRY